MPSWERMTAGQFATIARNRRARMPCRRPGCHRDCVYRHAGPGRQRAFCSDSCRVRYTRTRQQLVELWLKLEWNTGYLDPAIPLDEIANLQSHVAWELERYGGLDDSVYLALPEEPSRGGLTLEQHRQQLRIFYQGRRPKIRPEVVAARARRTLVSET